MLFKLERSIFAHKWHYYCLSNKISVDVFKKPYPNKASITINVLDTSRSPQIHVAGSFPVYKS